MPPRRATSNNVANARTDDVGVTLMPFIELTLGVTLSFIGLTLGVTLMSFIGLTLRVTLMRFIGLTHFFIFTSSGDKRT